MAYKLASQYKKYRYDAGGSMNQSTNSTAIGLSAGMGIAQGAVGIVDGILGTDDMGRKPMGASIATGAVQGASMGMAAGPYGAAAGAIIGAGVGYFTNAAQKRKNDALMSQYRAQQADQQRKRSQAAFAIDPSLAAGVQGASYYAMGGQMETAGGTVVRKEDRKGAQTRSRPLAENYLTRATKAEGGSLTPLSNDSVAINGPSHDQGGVQLPDEGAEVEGGESMMGNFVFSDRLGFAQEHKRLAGAIGKIQAKGVMTPEKVNSINRMQDRVQSLAMSQEYFKHILSGGQLPDPTQQPTS